MNRSVRRAGGLLVLLLVQASACHDGGKPDTLRLWAMGREGEVVVRMTAEFERDNPGIHVDVQQIPWSAAHEKLLTAYVGGSMPDVFQVGTTWVPELVAVGAVAALDDRAGASRSLRLDDYFPGVIDANRIGGTLYAVPWYVDTRVLFYRSDLLQRAGYAEPPRTWEEWLASMKRVRERDGGGKYAILLPVREWETPVILALQLGAELLRDGDRYGNFRGPEFRRAFELYLDLFERGLAAGVGETQVTNVYQDFAAGFFAFYITGPWNLGEFATRLPPDLKDAWATAPMPAPDEQYPGVSLAGGAGLAISGTSKHQDLAWKLVEYLSEPRRQVEFYRLTGDLPPTETAWKDPVLAGDPRAQVFKTQLKSVRSTPKIPEWERIASKVAQYAESSIRGRMTVEGSLTALDAEVDAILEKRRWLLRHQGGSGGARVEDGE
jgi:multiple sugar transport system substrate-binding protein